jgi:hypothetical protein
VSFSDLVSMAAVRLPWHFSAAVSDDDMAGSVDKGDAASIRKNPHSAQDESPLRARGTNCLAVV